MRAFPHPTAFSVSAVVEWPGGCAAPQLDFVEQHILDFNMCCELRLPNAVQEVLGHKKQALIKTLGEFNEKHAAHFSSAAQPVASGALVPVTPRRATSRGGETPRT